MSFPESWRRTIERRIARLDAVDVLRELVPYEPIDAVRVRRDGRELLLFASNDYLGLSSHPAVTQAVADVATRFGQGTRGSPLVCGYTTQHAELERELAALKGTEAALLCSSGFAANLAAITALADAETTIFSDALNHASIIDACRLAVKDGATLRVYPHADVEALATLMKDDQSPRKIIVTDSIFSMDGVLAPLVELAALKRRHDALLVVDEAHATLVFGPNGGGVAEQLGCSADVDVHIATLSKAAGTMGGFIATSDAARALILNRGRSYVFSTALPLTVVAAARAALKVAATGEHRERLRAHLARCSTALGREVTTPIIPIILGSERAALDASMGLLEEGFVVPAIRPPTVAPGTSRLRLTISAAHAAEDVDRVCERIARTAGHALGLTRPE